MLPVLGQAQHRAGTAKKRLAYKLKGPLLTTVLTRLRDRLSPEQICGELQRMATQKVLHHETIYRTSGPVGLKINLTNAPAKVWVIEARLDSLTMSFMHCKCESALFISETMDDRNVFSKLERAWFQFRSDPFTVFIEVEEISWVSEPMLFA